MQCRRACDAWDALLEQAQRDLGPSGKEFEVLLFFERMDQGSQNTTNSKHSPLPTNNCNPVNTRLRQSRLDKNILEPPEQNIHSRLRRGIGFEHSGAEHARRARLIAAFFAKAQNLVSDTNLTIFLVFLTDIVCRGRVSRPLNLPLGVILLTYGWRSAQHRVVSSRSRPVGQEPV